VDLKKFMPAISIGINIVMVLVDVYVLSTLLQKAREAVTTRSENLVYELQMQSAQKLSVDLANARAEQEKITAVLPDSGRLLEVIEFMEGLGEVTTVRSFSFASETPLVDAKGFGYLPFFIELEGSIGQTMAAMGRLDTAPYLMSVDQTVLESPQGLSQAVRLKVYMRLYVSQPFSANQ
jgi:hypothetical protein